MSKFQDELADLINKHSMENGSNTPDFILADYLGKCLSLFNATSRARERWYGKSLRIGGGDGIDPLTADARTDDAMFSAVENVDHRDAGSVEPSERAIHVAARVWCDQEMGNIVMDGDACKRIARIVDQVIKTHTQSDTEVIPVED